MSVDWEFCIVHEEPPNFTVEEMMKLLGHLDSAGYLQNIGFNGFRGDHTVDLENLEAVADWLQRDPGTWDMVGCDYNMWTLRDAEKADKQYPLFSRLSEELMDASAIANDSGAASPVYGLSVSPGGISMNMEGYSDDDKFLAELAAKPTVSALLEGLSQAVGRPMKMTVMESIAWMREVPEEEILARIKEEVEGAMASASDAFKALVTLLPEPQCRNYNESSQYPRLGYWAVTEEFEHNGHVCVAAYDPSVTCWYLARPIDKPEAEYMGYYPYSFGGFVGMIEGEMK